VVGAGIGGLACAVALRRVGWRVLVVERGLELAEVGAGLSLWSNALSALDALGLSDVRARGTLQASGGVRTWRGRALQRSSGARLQQQAGVEVLVVHRAELQRRLRAELPDDAVALGVEVSAVEQRGDGIRLSCGRGQSYDADVVVGADGVHSAVRRLVLPNAAGPRYAGFTAWRGITGVSLAVAPEPGVWWGPGSEVGAVPLVDGRWYWFATANLPGGTRYADQHAELGRRFAGWDRGVRALLDATPPAAVLHHDLLELPALPTYVVGRVALLGDAAHAMTPNLGQGACQALEDAVVLAACLREHAPVEGLRRYDAQRRPRTQQVARASRQLGRLVQTENPVLRVARDELVRLTPERLALAGVQRATAWTPPSL